MPQAWHAEGESEGEGEGAGTSAGKGTLGYCTVCCGMRETIRYGCAVWCGRVWYRIVTMQYMRLGP